MYQKEKVPIWYFILRKVPYSTWYFFQLVLFSRYSIRVPFLSSTIDVKTPKIRVKVYMGQKDQDGYDAE